MLSDLLLLVGESSEMDAFDELAKGEAAVPSPQNSCQWVRVTDLSELVDQTISDLYRLTAKGVQIQAIRRDGKFIRLPELETAIGAGDRLLLCGSLDALLAVNGLI